MCPGSLRYTGLDLINGNYTVTLHFAEIGFPNRNSKTWPGLARRIFDIYIQVGIVIQKDFDIAKKAGGVEKALVEKFNVFVSENYLEIHLFWAGKGTCCIPEQGYYGPLIVALHASSGGDKKNKTGMIIGVTASVVEKMTCTWTGLRASIYAWERQEDSPTFMKNPDQGLCIETLKLNMHCVATLQRRLMFLDLVSLPWRLSVDDQTFIPRTMKGFIFLNKRGVYMIITKVWSWWIHPWRSLTKRKQSD